MNNSFRFYNPGQKIFEAIAFDKPNPENNKETLNGNWALLAEQQSFFDAPAMIEIPGHGYVITNFDKTILRKFSERGMILIDPTKQNDEGNPYAPDEKTAKIKGDEQYHEYEMRIVQAYINNAETVKSKGLSVGPATGFVKHILKKYNIEDPGKSAENSLFRRKSEEHEGSVQKQLIEQAAQIKQLTDLLSKVDMTKLEPAKGKNA